VAYVFDFCGYYGVQIDWQSYFYISVNHRMQKIHTVLSFLIAAVWIGNGLFCKVLNLVPRHEQIVARILGPAYSRPITILIGLSEIMMAIWIISRIKPRTCALVQIIIVAVMNVLEFLIVPDLLLWGKLNSVFALLFILVVYFNEFHLNRSGIE